MCHCSYSHEGLSCATGEHDESRMSSSATQQQIQTGLLVGSDDSGGLEFDLDVGEEGVVAVVVLHQRRIATVVAALFDRLELCA